jgi:hypothetical protein
LLAPLTSPPPPTTHTPLRRAAAWRRASLGGRARVLRPLLATGVKAWHLREGCAFYPAQQFWAAADLVPEGADVVVVAGEIDCREGLRAAVEGLKARPRPARSWGGVAKGRLAPPRLGFGPSGPRPTE